MEITLIAPGSIKIRGKHAALAVNPTVKSTYNVALVQGTVDPKTLKVESEAITLRGPGDYEIGGIKISSIKAGNDTVYSIFIDELDILLGIESSLQKVQTKVKDHHIVLVQTDGSTDLSFVSGFSPRVEIFYGKSAKEDTHKVAKEGMSQVDKYSVTLEKLPQEPEEILLQ